MVTPLQVLSTTTAAAATKTPSSSSSSSSSSSTLSSMKIKTLIHTLIITHVCRIVRALSKAKSILVQLLKENQPIKYIIYPSKLRKHKERKIFFGSFRLHYNWGSSSHVLPVPAPVLEGFSSAPHLYYDSTWNSVINTSTSATTCEENEDTLSQLSGYLQWLEEKKLNQENSSNTNGDQEDDGENEIDRLADMFIASCHEKFRLEKQESYRRFQEMMARSI